MKRFLALLLLLGCGQAFAQTAPAPPPLCYPPFAVNGTTSITASPPALGIAFIETWWCPDPTSPGTYKPYSIVGYFSELAADWAAKVSALSTTTKATLDGWWNSNIIDNDHELDGLAQTQLANTKPPATAFLRGMLPAPVTIGTVVYYVIQQPDKFVEIPVGTAPVGTTCDMTQSVDNMNGVPISAVTWYGTVHVLVVVAPCG